MAEKLRPCPFCGGEAKEFTGEDAAPHRWTVECDSCGAHVGSDTRHKARAKWNRRAGRTCNVESSHVEQEMGDYSYLEVECPSCHALLRSKYEVRGADGEIRKWKWLAY